MGPWTPAVAPQSYTRDLLHGQVGCTMIPTSDFTFTTSGDFSISSVSNNPFVSSWSSALEQTQMPNYQRTLSRPTTVYPDRGTNFPQHDEIVTWSPGYIDPRWLDANFTAEDNIYDVDGGPPMSGNAYSSSRSNVSHWASSYGSNESPKTSAADSTPPPRDAWNCRWRADRIDMVESSSCEILNDGYDDYVTAFSRMSIGRR
jgi:hypothetical protein